jgi:8-oxo-dGTP pyrophosphatase MutT (NUDIX family)
VTQEKQEKQEKQDKPGKKHRGKTRNKKPRDETSAGGIVFRKEGADHLYLLIRDSYRNWGFPKGHLEAGELPDAAALREVTEETGLTRLALHSAVETIDWHFRFRGRLIHKVCHFYLMESADARTKPQRAEGITACRWARYADASRLLSYANAREVLAHAHELLIAGAPHQLPVVAVGAPHVSPVA